MDNHIITYSKMVFDILEPKKEQIKIEDIAHALSMLTRANGHFPDFFSVAQHCIQCANEAIARNYSPRVVMACLLHDASEAYLSDITRPVKKNMTMYLQIEEQMQNTIYDKFLDGIPTEEEFELIKNIDDACLYYEFNHFMGEKIYKQEPLLVSEPGYEVKAMKEVEEEFIWMFRQILRELMEA